MLIGIAGFARSGKDEAATALNNFRKDSFAYQLKLEVTAMLEAVGVRVDFSNPKDKKLWRKILVAWGKQRRNIQSDYWIKPVADRYERGKCDTVVTDVRYLNEVKWILDDPDGHIIRIHRVGVGPANEEEERSFSEINSHTLSNRFHNIYNNFSKEHLYSEVRQILDKIKPPST